MLLDYKINYETEISKSNARKYILQYYYLKSHNVDPYNRMAGDKTAGKKLKWEDCGEERRDFRLWPSDLYKTEMMPEGTRRQVRFRNMHHTSLIQISCL